MDKTIKCPNCGEAFDNVSNEFLECSHCGKKYKNPFYRHDDAIEQEPQHDEPYQNTEPTQNATETQGADSAQNAEPAQNSAAAQTVDATPDSDASQNAEITSDSHVEPHDIGGVFVNGDTSVHAERERKANKHGDFSFTFDTEPEKTTVARKNVAAEPQKNRESDAFMRVVTNTIKEFFEFKQFKRIPVGLAVVAGILLSPFLLSFIFMIPAFYILQFCYKIVSAPADFLLRNLRDESDETAVKAVVYFIGYPIVFLMKVALSAFSVEFFVMYFFFMLFGYIYGCGGIKFQPFIFEATTDCSAHLEGKASKKTIAIILTVCILIGVFVLGMSLGFGIVEAGLNDGGSGGSSYGGGSSGNLRKLDESIYVSSYGNGQRTYYFTPSADGYYKIEVSGNFANAQIYVYVDGITRINTSVYSTSDTMYMNEGETYRIVFSYANYYSNTCTVYLSVSK